jgi:hypothetical protein
VDVERGRIGGADPAKSSFAAPELHAAHVVRVENPHALPSQRPWMKPASPKANLLQAKMIRTR